MKKTKTKKPIKKVKKVKNNKEIAEKYYDSMKEYLKRTETI